MGSLALWLLKGGKQLASPASWAYKKLLRRPTPERPQYGTGRAGRTPRERIPHPKKSRKKGAEPGYTEKGGKVSPRIEVVNKGRMLPSDPGGLLIRKPWLGITTAGALGGGGYLAYKGLLEPEKKPTGESTVPTPDTDPDMRKLTEEQPSMSPGHRAAYLKKRRSRIKKGMKRLLNQYMIIAAVNPDGADEFMKSGMKMMEMDQEFNDDIYMQDAYDSIFQEGNMPTSGRDAFERLVNVVGYKDASDVSGVYKDLEPDAVKPWQYAKKEYFQWQNIEKTARSQGIEAAARQLVGHWTSGAIEPDYEIETMSADQKLKKAIEVLKVVLNESGTLLASDEDPLIKGVVG